VNQTQFQQNITQMTVEMYIGLIPTMIATKKVHQETTMHSMRMEQLCTMKMAASTNTTSHHLDMRYGGMQTQWATCGESTA
jgi:hypothetical protein